MKKLMMLGCMGLSFALSSAAIANPQHDRMRSCNKTAKADALKGSERKAFMKECLSNKSPLVAKKNACKKDAKEKELKGDAHKAFMNECMKG